MTFTDAIRIALCCFLLACLTWLFFDPDEPEGQP